MDISITENKYHGSSNREINMNTKEDESESGNGPSGLDLSTANEWIYPTNYPMRDYQKNIVSKALFQNTLVSLPTGLGKTFIAAVVMYNYSRWFPHHKVVFMAHSKPLVAQQIDACCQIMGISQRVTAQLNGNIHTKTRKQHWETKQIFFLTPQVFNNDLTRGLVSAESIRCVVIDEAHKALGNQAFCQVIRALQPFNTKFRVLALSATPGDDIPMVKSVIENLLISHLELRTEEDPDIQKYLHEKKVETVVVNLDDPIIRYKNQLLRTVEKYLRQLVQMKAISGSFGSLSSFSLVLKQKQFIANPSVGSEQRGFALSNFSIAISLYKALEELVIHGLRSFHNKLLVIKSGEGTKNNIYQRLAKDKEFLELVDAVGEYIGQDNDVSFNPDVSIARLQDELESQVPGQCAPLVYSHPKFVMLEQIITQHFDEWKDRNESTRVIVFCKSRPCTGEICNFLNRFRPAVKPMVLIGQGQGTGGSTSRGFKQSAQLEVMRKFRGGQYNTLVATCVGEEGLDVGEVDLIINFDASRNSNTLVQRAGRTGRKRDGRVVNLLTEGKEQQDYNLGVSKSKKVTKKLSAGIKNLPLYSNSPRLVPYHTQSKCQEMFLKPVIDSPKKAKSENESSRMKKKTPKGIKRKNCDSLSQGPGAKYDIRYAMSKAKERIKEVFCGDDTSDSLFEAVGAVGLFKGKQNKAHNETIEVQTSHINIPSDVICLDDSIDDLPSTGYKGSSTRHENAPQVRTFSCKESDILKKILTFPLDSDACDLLDNLSIEELVELISSNISAVHLPDCYTADVPVWCYRNLPSSSDSEDSSELKYHDIILPSFPVPQKEISSTDYGCEDDLIDINITINEGKVEHEAAMREVITSESSTGPETALIGKDQTFSQSINACELSIGQHGVERAMDKAIVKTFISSASIPKIKNTAELSEKPNLHERDIQSLADEADTTQVHFADENLTKQSDVSMVTVTQAISMITSFKGEQSPAKTITLPLIHAIKSTDKNCEQKSAVFKGFEENSCAMINASAAVFADEIEERSIDCIDISWSPNNKDQPCKRTAHLNSLNVKTPPTSPKPRVIDDTSPSLVSSGTIRNTKRNSRVKKSLYFPDPHKSPPPSNNFTLLNAESDEDLFAEVEKEREVRLTQNIGKLQETNALVFGPTTQAHNTSQLTAPRKGFSNSSAKGEALSQLLPVGTLHKQERHPKTAIVRPLGFENLYISREEEDGWLTTKNKPKASFLFVQSSKKKKTTIPKLQKSLDNFLKAGHSSVEINKSLPTQQSCSVGAPTASTYSPHNSNASFSTFDCIPDDLAHILDASPIRVDKFSSPLHQHQTSMKQSTPVFAKCGNQTKNPDFVPCDDVILEDDELSDGALEAIKAVEEYEKAAKPSASTQNEKKLPQRSETPVFNLWSSDDSDDVFERKPLERKNTINMKNDSMKKNEVTRISKKRCRNKRKNVNPFVEEEAELSASSMVSSDENTSGLDEMDSSFLDERLAPTQAPGVDMTARYLATVKSPRVISGAFKIPAALRPCDRFIFSQVERNDDDYVHDSFCVPDANDPQEEELSFLERAELILEKRRKGKKKRSPESTAHSPRRKKRKRIISVESSSDDDVQLQPMMPSSNTAEGLRPAELQAEPLPHGQVSRRENSTFALGNLAQASSTLPPVILIGSRQIASAPEITTTLRAKFNYRLEFRSSPGADFIVGWRLGINRVTLSDFSNGSPAVKGTIREAVVKMAQLFLKPVMIVEDDKEKSAPRTVGCNKVMWMKHSAKRLSRLYHAGVSVLFTRNKDETARTIHLLAQMERDKGCEIVTEWLEINEQLESRLKFYTTLPGVNIAMALRLCRKFSTLSSFLSVCDSVDALKRELGVPQALAIQIYQAIILPPTC